MNNFRRSVEEIVQVVKIADTTLRKRLEEFKQSPSGGLTLEDFRTVWLEEEMDPPAFTKGKEKEDERWKRDVGEKKNKQKAKRKRKRGEDPDQEHTQEIQRPPSVSFERCGSYSGAGPRTAIDPVLLNEGILAGTSEPLFVPEYEPDPDLNIDPALLSPRRHSPSPPDLPLPSPPPTTIIDETASIVLSEEVATFLQGGQGSMLIEALDEAEQRRMENIQTNVDSELLGLDDEELDRFLLTDEEVKIKERVWVELNKDYLEAIAGKDFIFSCPT
jgi:transcription factor IIIB subunit 2